MFEREALYKRPAEIISADKYQSSSFSLMKLGWNSTFGKRERRMSMDVKSLFRHVQLEPGMNKIGPSQMLVLPVIK